MVIHRVSVVMPVYNGELHVAEAIESVLGQTQPPDELVVVDDGSTDGTPQILDRYGSRIVRLRQSHAGAAAAVNRGLGVATGDVLGFQDADDIWCRDKLSRQLESLDARPEIDAVFGMACQFVSPEVPESRKAALAPKIGIGRGELRPCMLIRRGAFHRIGPFDPALSATAFIEWLGRAKRMGLRYSMLDEVVLLRRLHLSNYSRVNLKERDQDMLLGLHSLIRARRAQKCDPLT